jgi:hypothetical protein
MSYLFRLPKQKGKNKSKPGAALHEAKNAGDDARLPSVVN